MLFEVPQKSIFGHFLFQIFLHDLFFMRETDFVIYAGHNTLHLNAEAEDDAMKALVKDSTTMFQ